MTVSALISLSLISCLLLPLSAAQASCVGRCGEPFTRGQPCNCDFNCLTHNECCKDYEDVCTIRGSCRGRCGEVFRRGKGCECECDADCALYNTCCSDYSRYCALPRTKPQQKPDVLPLKAQKKPSDISESEEQIKVFTDIAGGTGLSLSPGSGPSVVERPSELMPLTEDHTEVPLSLHPAIYPSILQPALPAADGAEGPAAGFSQLGAVPAPGKPVTIPVQVSLAISGHVSGAPQQPPRGPAPAQRPSTLTDITQALGLNSPPPIPNESSSLDLCSGLPIDALTSLFNGSIIIFRGHFFWLLNPRTRAPGPAQSITEQLGIPSPIDTAFTRCNCQGKTFIIKGNNYWVFENGVMEPGYPRTLSQDFDGLSGEITAALSVPATRKTPEAVYFFKKGGTVQKFSYPAGSGPSCSGKKVKNSVYNKIRRARRAELRLSAEINIKLNWKGFPTPVTSALSAPNPRKPDGFEYFIFSWPNIFNIKISNEFPTLAFPEKPPAQQNNIRIWLHCP
ncbi:proteoglycan 4a [Hoplias malabaricus]|uniref:proteoglycan 4a n=1 Tax=Hoplias malabaricus TaxID=27720 RepID=UPI0034625F8C